MAECPKCQVQLNIPEVSFGTLYTCENCQAVFFVDWSGNPEAPMETPGEVPMETPAEAPLESPLEPPLESPIAESPLEFEPVVAPPLEPMVVQESAIEVTDQPNFQEVVNFGNEIETNKVMTYSLYIEGIEIADLRSKFHEAITDSRFQWDAEEIMAKIQNGSVTLHDLSPAKAVVLINRIKYLGLDVSWKQKVL